MNEKHTIERHSNDDKADDARVEILEQYRQGASLASLAEEFGCSQRHARRLLRRARYERIAELPLDYMPSDEFESDDAERRILSPLPEPEYSPRKARTPSGLPPYLASLYEVALLTTEQEKHLFRQYNYLKHRAAALREALDARRPQARAMSEIERLYDQAAAVKNQLVRANLRLVVSIAKKHVGSPEELFERISEGNISLMKAVEKFDYTRGFKFSTYATWAIKKNFIRSYGDRMKRLDRFRTSREELLDAAVEQRSDPYVEQRDQQRREADVSRILDCLTHRERDIIGRRFGLGRKDSGETFKQIGDDFGLSKERIRQIEQRALAKLREAAEQQRIESAA
ncbi:MAG: sigma-70 family RNA polymerase sigma factor [Pirellulaceae bacterium]